MLSDFDAMATVAVRNLPAAAQFYEGKLGFRAADEVAGGVAYDFANGTGCFLYPTSNAGTNRASQAFWRVDDIEREVADLKARGVTFEEYDQPEMKTVNGIATAGGARAAWFKDTEGNILAIIQDVRHQR